VHSLFLWVKKMIRPKKTVYGIGINDSDYVTQPKINGKQVMCPFYSAWRHMIQRCYSSKFQATRPTYAGCSVAPEWHSFMAFRAWMAGQPWEGMQLDKDLLVQGNKIYSPQTCVFVSAELNSFTTDHAAARGEWPIGVDLDGSSDRLRARCSNPFTGKHEHLGLFTCPDEAHEAWRKRKHELALQFAGQQTDPRVAKALSSRYA
jgi:hypothetical protein